MPAPFPSSGEILERCLFLEKPLVQPVSRRVHSVLPSKDAVRVAPSAVCLAGLFTPLHSHPLCASCDYLVQTPQEMRDAVGGGVHGDPSPRQTSAAGPVLTRWHEVLVEMVKI